MYKVMKTFVGRGLVIPITGTRCTNVGGVSSMQIAGLGTRGSGTCGTGTAVLGHAELGQFL